MEITLRPVGANDLDLLVRWRDAAVTDDPYGFFGHHATTVRERHAKDGLLSPEAGVLMVDAGGTAVGEVSWHAVDYGPPPSSRALNVGISLAREHRGKGYGTQAQRALAGYLFATYPLNRVEASTDVTNVAEQRALEKAGFTREGVLRGAQWRAGEWHDLVGYARVRGDA
jgi:RimJ/RimL family protein N-acetyltransferase